MSTPCGQQAREAQHAVVLSIDEKSQSQALDRTQPGLPMKRGRLATMPHDDKRNGTTTLFAARNVLDGTVIGQHRQRHRHQALIQFLDAIERQVPADEAIHVVLDKSMVKRPSIPLCAAGVGSKPTTGAAHKHAKVRARLDRQPRWTFPFTPTSCSWLDAGEGFFAKLTRRRLRHGVCHSLVDLQRAIDTIVAIHDAKPKPFV